MSSLSTSVIRFEEYEIDRACWQMRWRAEPIPLNRKTFDLLLYLIDRRDRVAGKDELLKALWPDQFVEESNLTQHVFLLRKALSRHNSGVKLIETIPGRGYRFAAQVEAPAVTEQMTIGVSESITRIRIEEESESMAGPAPSPERVFGFLPWGLVALLGVAILVSGGLFLRWRSAARAHAQKNAATPAASPVRQTVAVLGFHNSSNRPEDAWLSTAVAEMLASEMTAGDDLRVIPTDDVARAALDLGIKDSPIDTDTKRASLSQATGADLLVKGSYVVVSQGSTPAIRLMLQLQDARSGGELATISKTGNMAELFKLVDEAGAQMRGNVSQRVSRTEQEAALSGMSHSVDALRLYAEGLARERSFDSHAAQNFFEGAVKADPGFAMAHLGLADAFADLGFTDKARGESAEAMKLSINLPREERLAVEAEYEKLSNNSERAISLYKALATFYPDEATWGLKLATEQVEDGRHREAVDTLEGVRKLRLTPAQVVDLDGIEAGAYAHLDEPLANDQARSRLNEAIASADKQGGPSIHGRAYRCKCFALSHIGPVPDAQSACEQAKTTFQALGNLHAVASADNNLGVLAQQVGAWKQAQAEYEEASRTYHQLGNLEAEADELQNLALLNISQGDLAKAFDESSHLSLIKGTADDSHTAYEGHHYASIALLLGGRLREAQTEALEAQQAADGEHTWDFKVFQQARARDVRGFIALRAGDDDQAQALFHEALTLVGPSHDEVGEAIFTADATSVVLEQGHAGKDALDGVRHAAAVLSKLQDESDEAIEAEIALAELDCRTGAIDEAAQVIGEAKKLDQAGDSLDTHLDVLLGEAELLQSQGRVDEAKKILQEEIAGAKAKGFAYSGLAGEIALAKLDAKTEPSTLHAGRMQALAQRAERAGFKGLARRALAL